MCTDISNIRNIKSFVLNTKFYPSQKHWCCLSCCCRQKLVFLRYNFIHWPLNFVTTEGKPQNWRPVLSTSAFTWLSLYFWRYFNQLIHTTTANDHKNISVTVTTRETYCVILKQQLKSFGWMSMKPKGVLNYLSHEIFNSSQPSIIWWQTNTRMRLITYMCDINTAINIQWNNV
jgi:hypothetical protein